MGFTELYCDASAGSNLNGGAPIGGSYPFTYTGGNWVAATGVFTVASGNPQTDGVTVGDFASVYADGASAPTGFVGRVTARDSTTITVSLTAKSGTAPTDGTGNRTVKVGGAWKGPTGTSAFPFGFITATLQDASANTARVNFKSGTAYSVTAAMTHSNAGPMVFQGYTSSAGDGGKATIDGGTSGASYVLLTVSAARNHFLDLIFQNNGASGSADGVSVSSGQGVWQRCVFNSFRGNGVDAIAGMVFVECEAYSCNASNVGTNGGFKFEAAIHAYRCIAHDNTGNATGGFVLTASCHLQDCIADTNGKDGFLSTVASGTTSLKGCVAYNNTGSGVLLTGNTTSALIDNTLLVSNGAYGVSATGTTPYVVLENCAFFSNTSGQTNGINAGYVTGSVTLSADPFTAASTGNFTLDNTASEGAACRGAGRGAFTQTQASYTGTVGYPDIGAAQHQDTGGSGGMIIPTLPTIVL